MGALWRLHEKPRSDDVDSQDQPWRGRRPQTPLAKAVIGSQRSTRIFALMDRQAEVAVLRPAAGPNFLPDCMPASRTARGQPVPQPVRPPYYEGDDKGQTAADQESRNCGAASGWLDGSRS